MNCPKCNALMEPVTLEGVTVDRCTGCKGIWLDAGEQKQLGEIRCAEAIDTGNVQVGKRMNEISDIKCPRCQGKMEQRADVDQHHIVLEVCTVCKGIYLDAGEFKDLQSYNLMDYFRGLFRRGAKKE